MRGKFGEYQQNTRGMIRGILGVLGSTKGEYSKSKRGVLKKYLGTVTRGTLRRY